MPPLLREIPENPVPKGAEAGIMVAADGRRIRYACFRSGGRNGTVVILPGRNECIEKYFETVDDLAARGFDAAALDWRGQGGSERLLRDPLRGHVDSFNDYVRDLDQFFREIVLPDCRPPYTILAHSTGALITLLATPYLANRVRRVVLLASLFEFSAPLPQRWVKRIARLFFVAGLGSRYIAGASRRGKVSPFQKNKLTSDPERFRRNQALIQAHPDLAIGGPTAAWIYAMCTAIERVRAPEFMNAVHLPILFLAAGADEVVSTPAIERYARGLRSAKVLTIDGARHELLQESEIYREQVFVAFENFARPKHEDGEPGLETGII